MSITFSKKQKTVINSIQKFFLNTSNLFYVLNGYAGTGKTTIIGYVNHNFTDLGYHVINLAFTGKAVSVMRKKGIPNASTLHSFLYQPIIDEKTMEVIDYVIRPKEHFAHVDFIVVDEASMVPEKIFYELLELGIPILFVGDSFQLPPIADDFNVMDLKDITLDEIHRQCEGNPIIEISRGIRENGCIPNKYIDDRHVFSIDKKTFDRHPMDMLAKYECNPYSESEIILCGSNSRREKLNVIARAAIGTHTHRLPQVNEKIMCTKNKAIMKGEFVSDMVYNGEIYVIDYANYINEREGLYAIRNMGSKTKELGVDNDAWNDMDYKSITERNHDNFCFVFSYACTVHKSQGSEFDNVIFYRENVDHYLDQNRFDYTAVTRAKNKLIIVR